RKGRHAEIEKELGAFGTDAFLDTFAQAIDAPDEKQGGRGGSRERKRRKRRHRQTEAREEGRGVGAERNETPQSGLGVGGVLTSALEPRARDARGPLGLFH